MKRFILIILTIVFSFTVQAQTGTPPAGYLDSCNAEPVLYDYFGPNCLNPVTWDLEGFIEIGQWVFFTLEDGTTDMGLIQGYTWDFVYERYEYWVMTQMPFEGFGGAFNRVAPETIINYSTIQNQ